MALREAEFLPDNKRFCNEKTPTRIFIEEQLKEFAESDMKIAVVEGWPEPLVTGRGGITRTAKDIKALRRTTAYNAAKPYGIQVFSRGDDIYLVKEEQDGD